MCYICCKSHSMLEVKDLRIGNLFNHFEDGILPIEEIKKDSDGFEGYYAVFRNGSTKCHVSYLAPIELTEEWLLRFGLTKHNGYPYKFLDGFIKIRNGEYFFKYHNLDIKLNYVHNLQNLHYILTQTELTLKDEK